ncbi:MAG: ATP-binding protein [Gammaproteobacteria bacterium]|nr:ATP-binding protein [Gammaproteobacteria bacterium]
MASLRTRIVWILLALILVAWVASALVTFVFTSRVMLDQVDRQLEQYADLVNYITAVFARQVDEGVPLSEPWLSGKFETAHLQPIVINTPTGEKLNPALNIWLGQNLIAVMADSPRFDRPSREGLAYGGPIGDERKWRILTRHDPVTGLWLQVGIEMGGARRAMLGMLGRALLPLLLVLPLTVALLYFGVSRGLKPLKTLANQIALRNPTLLDPVNPAGVPAEMQGVVSSLNRLLQRLALALEGEQRFTANAAHELLTPLAAIKTEVQLCQLQLGDERGAAMLDRIAKRVDRASHTVAQLLTLARLDPEQPLIGERVRLDSLLSDVMADTVHLADERGLKVAMYVQEEVYISGSEDSLAILLCNLLINAFRYASEGSTVSVHLRSGEAVELEIDNQCPPLSGQEFDRICERFYRAPGASGQGAGLGLSIVARIADQHGARMSVGPGDGQTGFRVTLEFPAPLADA